MNGPLNLHPKVTATGLAGALVVVIVYVLHQWAHTDLPDVVSAALVVIFGFVAGWLAPATTALAVASADPSSA